MGIDEKDLGKDHPDVAASLNNLATLYEAQGKYAAAEPLYKRSLGIWEKALGKDHPDVATALTNLAGLYKAQGKDEEAKEAGKRARTVLAGHAKAEQAARKDIAQEAKARETSGGLESSWWIIGLLVGSVVLVYFLLIRPKRKQQKELKGDTDHEAPGGGKD